MQPFPRALGALAVCLALANCSTASEATLPSRNAPSPQPPAAEMAAEIAPRDLACLAEAVYFEARGTGAQGQRAVAHVVVNRAGSGDFPRSICGVVGDGCQFSYRCDGTPDVLADPNARAQALRTAEVVLEGAPDITRGALFFHSAAAAPGWFNTRPRVGAIGGNVFYR